MQGMSGKDEKEALATAEHVVKRRRALVSERHLPRWLTLEDLGQRLGQLCVERPVTIIVRASQAVNEDVVALEDKDPRPRAFRPIGSADHCLP